MDTINNKTIARNQVFEYNWIKTVTAAQDNRAELILVDVSPESRSTVRESVMSH